MSTCDALSDAELIARFESLELSPRDFGHREHVRLAFAVLAEAGDFGDAAIRYRRGLRAFATAAGAAAKYHETLTWAYLALVHERMYLLFHEHAPCEVGGERVTDLAVTEQPANRMAKHSITSFDLLARFPELLDHRTGALARYYDLAAITSSATARAVFVLPERA
jgi:hypothetical protein